MAFSSSSIFHYTRSEKGLLGILKEGFKMTYCLERFRLYKDEWQAAIPMVTFCDIPISQAYNHMKKYGKYGIGLSKEWASRMQISPVYYTHPNSISMSKIEPLIHSVLENPKWQTRFSMRKTSATKYHIKDIYKGDKKIKTEAMLGLFSYFKNHTGQLYRNDKLIDSNYIFYDEREWRYVPYFEEFEHSSLRYEPLLSYSEYQNWRGIKKVKDFIPKLNIPFTGNDIEYIIIKEDSNLSNFINKLKTLNNLYSNDSELNILYSKIISYERLLRDF